MTFNIAPETLSHKVPAFILQPLVENAIKYGITSSSGSADLMIEAMESNGNMRLSVRNDGTIIDFNNFKEGIGISNTKERLSQLYNGKSSFELKNISDRGVLATIIIPIS